MSLDVYLEMKGAKAQRGSGIFVRENGSTKEISMEEWNDKFPGREPCIVVLPDTDDDGEVYWRNITHNLGEMASKVSREFHDAMWFPSGVSATMGKDLIPHLQRGIEELAARPEHYKTFNPKNGWGNYENLLDFAQTYLAACKAYPEATIRVSA